MIHEDAGANTLPSTTATISGDDVCVMPMSFGQEQLWLTDRYRQNPNDVPVLVTEDLPLDLP